MANTAVAPTIRNAALRDLDARIPACTFHQDKWATLRTQNIEEVAEFWKDNPRCVRVLTDRKFGTNSMVMMRKDLFESMLNTLKDLTSGEAVIKTNLDAVIDGIKLIEKLISPTKEEDALVLAVKQLTRCTATISTVIEHSAPKRRVKPSVMTEEELAELKKYDKDLP